MPQALHNLAAAYANGQGVARDYGQAYYYLTLADGQGQQGSRQLRDVVARRMTAAEIAQAEAKAREWKPAPAPDSENLLGLAMPTGN